MNVCEAFLKCAWHGVSAIHVRAVFGRVAIINRKQDLSLWGQESLVNSFV